MVEETQNEMKVQLDRYLTVQKELVLQLSDDEEDGHEMSLSEKMQEMCIAASVAASTVVNAKTRDTQSISRTGAARQSGLEIKLERMKLPHFS